MFRSHLIKNTQKTILKEFPDFDSTKAFSVAEKLVDSRPNFDFLTAGKFLLQCLTFGVIYVLVMEFVDRYAPESELLKTLAVISIYYPFFLWLRKLEARRIRSFVQTNSNETDFA